MKKIEFALNCYGTYFELNKNANNKNLNAFLTAIFKENKIDTQNTKESLLKKINEGHLIYPGGLTFYKDNDYISTGCCFDINDVNKTRIDMINFNPTWLGHDPDSTVVYEDNKIIVVSDDYDPYNGETAITIEYTKEELNTLFNLANDNFKQFVDVFYDYLKHNYSDIADILIEDLKKCTLF